MFLFIDFGFPVGVGGAVGDGLFQKRGGVERLVLFVKLADDVVNNALLDVKSGVSAGVKDGE